MVKFLSHFVNQLRSKRFVKQVEEKVSEKDFWKYFFVALGTISSVVTLVSFVFQLVQPHWAVVLIYILLVLGLSVAFGLWQTYRKTSLSIAVSNNLKVSVQPGDLFSFAKDSNYVVIPVNEFFDTVVDESIINSGSIHGQFINRYYQDDHSRLHEEIEDYFSEHSITGEEAERPQSKGYTKKYPLGTCAIIEKENVRFVLMAFTHFNNNDIAFVELSELGLCVSKMLRYLSNQVGTSPVYMPLMGMGLSRLNQPAQFILKYTLDTIVGIGGLAQLGGVNIIVYPPIAKTINLNEISYPKV